MQVRRRYLLAALAVGLLVEPRPAAAQATRPGAIRIEGAWARPTAPRQANGAAYMALRNTGTTPDRLIGASSSVARAVELHTHSIDAQGVARMRQVDAIELTPGEVTALAPGGLHVMLVDLTRPLALGQPFPLVLRFAAAGEISIEVQVTRGSPDTGPAAQAPGHGTSH